MARISMGKLPNGEVNAYFKNIAWKRRIEQDENGDISYRWRCLSSRSTAYSSRKFHRLLEGRFRSDDYKEVQRFPRRSEDSLA